MSRGQYSVDIMIKPLGCLFWVALLLGIITFLKFIIF